MCEPKPETETFAEHLLRAQMRLLSTQKLLFMISGRRDFGMAGRVTVSLRVLSNCGDELRRL